MKHLGLMKTRWFVFVSGVLLASVILLGIRFATYSIPNTHYHANFAVYINGEREEFKDKHYYEEVAACTLNGPIQPAQRAHMHEEVNDAIHVHDDGVTWGQFFNNIGWTLGPNYIQNYERKLYVADDTDKLNIVLNGDNLTDLTTMNNEVIKSEDRLLISYGEMDDERIAKEFKSVAATARKYNSTPDPASCSGQKENPPISERFKHLF